jgi:excisionase family DNA binding protein
MNGTGNIQMSNESPTIVQRRQVTESYQSAEDLAVFLQVHPKTLLRMARQGKIPAHPFGDGQRRRWRFLVSEVDAWMRSRVLSSDHPCRVEGEVL